MMVANNHNLFPLPYWAPALWRVPIPLQLLNEAYAAGARAHSRRPRHNAGDAQRLHVFVQASPAGEDAAHERVHGAREFYRGDIIR